MRVALLISGYLRSFKVNVPNIKKNIINKFNDVDIYIHLTKNEKTEDKYLNEINFEDIINYINSELNPTSLICEDNINHSKSDTINGTYNLWLKFYKLNELKKVNEVAENKLYDLVIKYRPDLDIISENIFDIDIYDNMVYIPKESVIDKNKLLKEDDKYICDLFAFGKSLIMNKYFEIHKNIDVLFEKYGYVSETILYHHLNDNNIGYELLDINYNVILSKCNVFAIAGDSGSGKTTLGRVLKKYFSKSFMLECDRYHKWERNDENWKKLTHLNPDSNFLTKMNQDIFDLKVGKDVYQVDYDHKTGKFTDKQLINSDSDNIIVCGLHSLYNENDNLYNLKIFIDTDEQLKTKWKIERDVKERGHSLEKVLEQIKLRKDDYIRYILPQKDKSDLIVNFYENNGLLGLKLYIKKEYNNHRLYETFLLNGVDFEFLTFNDNYDVYDFKQYKKINFWLDSNTPTLDNFYDYIVYTIFTLHENFK
jgi:uridine kinase